MRTPSWVQRIRAIAWQEATDSFFECRCFYLGDMGEGDRWQHIILLDISGKKSGYSEQLMITLVDRKQLTDEEIAQWLKEQVQSRSLSWHPRDLIERYHQQIAVFLIGLLIGSVL